MIRHFWGSGHTELSKLPNYDKISIFSHYFGQLNNLQVIVVPQRLGLAAPAVYLVRELSHKLNTLLEV